MPLPVLTLYVSLSADILLRKGGVPIPPSVFTPRPNHVVKIKEALMNLKDGPGWCVVHGMGGIGKSVIAAASVRDTEILSGKHQKCWVLGGKFLKVSSMVLTAWKVYCVIVYLDGIGGIGKSVPRAAAIFFEICKHCLSLQLLSIQCQDLGVKCGVVCEVFYKRQCFMYMQQQVLYQILKRTLKYTLFSVGCILYCR